jgi:hypothetical protein
MFTRRLTADELEELRHKAREGSKLARKAFGGRARSRAEIEAERRGDEWWERRLKEMRAEEAKSRNR